MQEMITIIKILIKNELYHDALVKVEIALRHVQEQKLKEYHVVCDLLKIQIYFHLQLNINEAIVTLQ